MRLSYIKTDSLMTMRAMMRNRFALVVLLTIPALFFTLVWLTTGDHPVIFRLASVSDETAIEVGARDESLVFVGVAVVGLLSSFLAMNLVQKNTEENRRLILCGFHPAELVVAKLLGMIVVVAAISLYVGLMLSLFFRPLHFVSLVIGLALSGFVHACYGLLVGTVMRRELEGVLLIVLLVNIDAGWLQNPLYYAEAHNKALIRYLPAYFPSQASIASAFTDHSTADARIGSLVYGGALLSGALAIYFYRMKVVRRVG